MRGPVRPAVPEDAARLAEILVFAKRTAYRSIFRNDDFSFNRLRVVDLAEELQQPGALDGVSVYDDRIVKGLLRLEERPDADGALELRELYVDPFFQGMGVGGMLISHGLETARSAGAERITLWVLEKNHSAQAFYKTRGFAPDGRRELADGTAETELGYGREIGGGQNA